MIPLILIVCGLFLIIILVPVIHERLHLRKIRQLGGDGYITHGIILSTMTHTLPLKSYDDYIAVAKAPIRPTFFIIFVGLTLFSTGVLFLETGEQNIILASISFFTSIPLSVLATYEACKYDFKKIHDLEEKKRNEYPFAVFLSCIEQVIDKSKK